MKLNYLDRVLTYHCHVLVRNVIVNPNPNLVAFPKSQFWSRYAVVNDNRINRRAVLREDASTDS